MLELLRKWIQGLDKKAITDGEIELRLKRDEAPNHFNDHVRTLVFDIRQVNSKKVIGCCELRLGMNYSLYYLGQIGYSVYPLYRGNHTAYKACRLLFDLAYHEYGLDELIITCNPDNIPSYKTLKRLQGELKEIVEVPSDHFLYKQGDRQKCIFYYELKKIYAEV